MFRKIFFASFALIASVVFVSAQTSWLDRPMGRNWNNGDGNVPQAPRTFAAIPERCRDQIRTPDSLADRAVTRAGWSLFGSSQTFGLVTIVGGMASTDGQCRPSIYNYFVFVNNRFAGTLSPDPMTSRTDGAIVDVNLVSESNMSAEFARYRASDPASSPSQRSVVAYRINRERNIVDARTVNTVGACPEAGDITTQDNVVSGTITYRGRNALPANAVISIRLLDATRQDTAGGVIAEDRIDAGGKQVPISFDLIYDPSRIQERNRYVIRAEIRDGERLLFTTDNSYPVITQGNPRSVEITVVQVGGGGFPGGGNRQNSIRGTVTYRQRIALGPNSEARVWLVDSGDPNGRPVAETTVQFGNRQVPIEFELPYEMRDINRQRNYEVWAEIRTGGQVRFRTERGMPVTLRGNETGNIEIIVVPAGPDVITGQTLSLSRIGIGSFDIEGRGSSILYRADVNIRTTGDAEVTLRRTGGSVTFSGKLVFFDQNTLRIAVQNSGAASASGEIEVGYSGRSMTSIAARNLILDGQNVTIRF